ncbi:hypothetical protein ACFVFI_10585 [Streptomyces sp. NPDC057705]|uniref:hypothetical protein n=1 Tax=Streptomyces sp. NPDC057705 TaxID=3346222 RepID=UPI00369BFCA5
MHTEPHQPLTPATRYGDPIHRPRPVEPHTVLLPTEVPPGVDWVTLPNGVRTLAYTQPHPGPATEAEPVRESIPRWAKTTALLAPTLGGGIAAAGFGISYAAPGLIAMTEVLWATVALIAASALVPLALRTRKGGGRAGGPVQHITQNISASGMFGRATGTLNNR